MAQKVMWTESAWKDLAERGRVVPEFNDPSIR
jgi:hypothetical protein